MSKLTLDTNVVDDTALITVARRLGCDLVVVSVTEREMEGSSYSVHLGPFDKVVEVAVWGEARWGNAVYASNESSKMLDQILQIISNDSFPKSRAKLSDGE